MLRSPSIGKGVGAEAQGGLENGCVCSTFEVYGRGEEKYRDITGLDASKQAAEGMGLQWKHWYMIFGRCDAVAVLEAPDDDTFMKFALSQAKTGTTVSETLKAFTEDDFRRIVASLPS